MPRLTVACALTKGERPELVGAEAHRARASTDRPGARRRARSCGGTTSARRDRDRPAAPRRARGRRAVPAGAAARWSTARSPLAELVGRPGLVRRRSRRRAAPTTLPAPAGRASGWSRSAPKGASTTPSCERVRPRAPRLARRPSSSAPRPRADRGGRARSPVGAAGHPGWSDADESECGDIPDTNAKSGETRH